MATKAARSKEHARICKEIVAAARWSGLLIHHAKNEETPRGSRGKFIGHMREMKAQGLHTGYPDLRIDNPAPKAPMGCAFEVKVPPDKVRDEQRNTIDILNDIGVRTFVVTHEDQALKVMKDLGYVIRPAPMPRTAREK